MACTNNNGIDSGERGVILEEGSNEVVRFCSSCDTFSTDWIFIHVSIMVLILGKERVVQSSWYVRQGFSLLGWEPREKVKIKRNIYVFRTVLEKRCKVTIFFVS